MIGQIKKFKLNNYMSTDFPTFDIICDVAFDGDNGGVSSHLAREAVASESYNGKFKHVHNLKYSDVFTFQMTLLRGDFGEFLDTEQRQIFSWLTSKETASIIDFYDDIDSNAITFSILGFVSEIESYKLGNGSTVGYVVTFESINPWALSPLQTFTETITTPQTFTINCDTDEQSSLLYPKVVITQGDSVIVQADHAMTNRSEHIDGTVYSYDNTYYWVDGNEVQQSQVAAPSNWTTTSVLIENTTLNTQTRISNNVVGEIIILDGANRVASSNAVSRILGTDFSWSWMPLRKGANVIKVTGNCTVVFTWRESYKVGEF